jgi:hypothetical protein
MRTSVAGDLGGVVETVAEFVRRTQGPVVPFVPGWYPWSYAHHYLRLESSALPAELGRTGVSLTMTEARELIHVWCALTGEGIEATARILADAYLRRWGLAGPAGERGWSAGTGRPGTGRAGTDGSGTGRDMVPGRDRRGRPARRWATVRGSRVVGGPVAAANPVPAARAVQ